MDEDEGADPGSRHCGWSPGHHVSERIYMGCGHGQRGQAWGVRGGQGGENCGNEARAELRGMGAMGEERENGGPAGPCARSSK